MTQGFWLPLESGQWKSKWRHFHANYCSCCTHAPAVVTTTTVHSLIPQVRRKRSGRPKKPTTKRGSGGGRNILKESPPAKPTTKRELKQRRVQRERLATYAFQSPPPFVPTSRGRKRKSPTDDSVFVKGVSHTLVHSSSLKKWKQTSDYCACCYALAPPPSSGRGRKKFMSDGSLIHKTSFACNICEKRLCKDCHRNVWPPHMTWGVGTPHGIVFT